MRFFLNRQAVGELLGKKESEAVGAKSLLDSITFTARTDEITGNSLSEETIHGESRSPSSKILESSALGHGSHDGCDPNAKRSGSPINTETQGLIPTKTARLNTATAGQASPAEVTMKKTRVSVRARSEASMVCVIYPFELNQNI